MVYICQTNLDKNMSNFLKRILFVSVLIASVSMNATNLEKVIEEEITPKKEASISTEEVSEKVDYKEVQDVFMKIKRIENIFSPKKKLNKKKYTIA